MSPQPTEAPENQVLAMLRGDLERLYSERIDSEVTLEKTWQYLRLRKADLYYRGLQFVAPSLTGGYPDYSPVGGSSAIPSQENLDARGLFDYNLDITRSYGRKYFGVLGMRPFWNAHAEPDDPTSEEDRRAAGIANLAADWLRKCWKLRIKNIELFYTQYKSGTPYIYHPFVADSDLFGEVEEPKYVERLVEVEPAGYRCVQCGLKSADPAVSETMNETGEVVIDTSCPQCGNRLSENNYEEAQTAPIPELQGNERYPGSGPAFTICSGYTVTVPFDCKAIDGKTPYLNYEYEENQGILLQKYGESLRKKVSEAGPGTSNLGANQGPLSRSMAASLTATPRQGLANRWTYTRTWLSTSMYEYITDQEKRKLLYQQFPDGLKIHKISDYIVQLENEALVDVWTPIPPEPGDTLYQDPMCWAILGHQDLKNDFGNIGVALLERGLPMYAVDPDVFSADAFALKPYSPVEVIEAKPGYGSRFQDAIKQFQGATFPEHMMQFDESIEGNAQQVLGLLPPVWGGGERQPTAEGQRSELNQALMQLGVPGEYAQMGFSIIFFKACKLIEKFMPKSVKGPTGDWIDPQILRSGHYHFECEPGIPMSWAEKKDQLNSIITQNPDLSNGLGLTNPRSAGAIRNYLLTNMPDIEVPDEAITNYVEQTIRELLNGQAIDDPMGGPPQPSIPPDQFIDPSYYQKCAMIAQEWLISGAGLKAKETNVGGYKNVLAWAMANAQAGQPPMPPPDMGQPEGNGGGQKPPQTNQAPPDIQPVGPSPVGPEPPAPQLVSPQQ